MFNFWIGKKDCQDCNAYIHAALLSSRQGACLTIDLAELQLFTEATEIQTVMVHIWFVYSHLYTSTLNACGTSL